MASNKVQKRVSFPKRDLPDKHEAQLVMAPKKVMTNYNYSWPFSSC
jgi:hypothetical protein